MLQRINKSKIVEPDINNIIDTKYNSVNKLNIISDCLFKNDLILLNQGIEISNCKFEKIIFDKVELNSNTFTDILFISCDLSNISFINSSFFRVKFINCKMYGTNFIDCSMNDVIIEESVCNLINIANTKIKDMYLNNSNFTESTFLMCKIKNMLLNNINLKSSNFSDTSLNNIDLSNSNIEGINIELNNIKGAIISSYQMMDLIGLLGVKIKE